MDDDSSVDASLTVDVDPEVQKLVESNDERIRRIDEAAATNRLAAQVSLKLHGSMMNGYLLTMLEVVVEHLGLDSKVVAVHARNVELMLDQAEAELEATRKPTLGLSRAASFPRTIR